MEQRIQNWLSYEKLDEELAAELRKIKDDDRELKERFHQHLAFGTGGLRGVRGAGTNRMNIYTVRRAAEGVARFLESEGAIAKEKGVAIAYDSRHHSRLYAENAALTLAAHGIRTYLFDELRPTPELSFAVRNLGAAAGIVITASHNPPEYNGFKVYAADGGQITPATAEAIQAHMEDIENELLIPVMEWEEAKAKGLLQELGEDMDEKYLSYLSGLTLFPSDFEEAKRQLRIVYTPLHGTGLKPVTAILNKMGFENVTVVPEQAEPDPQFSTVQSPNPEEKKAFTHALRLAEKINADMVMGTDPDADRVGVVVRDQTGEFQVLTGNQLGALLLYYILQRRQEMGKLPANGAMVKTIVTSELGRAIADSFGVKTFDTLTGFKFIGEKITEFEQTGSHTFLFGYEESYGYLIGGEVRDKDAVQACMMAAEMTAYYKTQNKTLYDQLVTLWERYGYFMEDLLSLTMKGIEGMEKIRAMMKQVRENLPKQLGGRMVTSVEDYLSSRKTLWVNDGNHVREDVLTLPRADVVRVHLEGGSWFAVRPSGTEPKIKFYFGVREGSLEEAKNRLDSLKQAVTEWMGI
ncbi:phosphomannomutase [Collibacillus ludicampi]|jgi:phosphoglucomutase|uniref:Phosphoglucomutase n=1 Tax=Collibacillus ludicampi TaxID=2771369 RepID=A0AAV4LDZ7_9BACL|nr:phospho-sugar mutase [Collibacillus ludicampi]GIM46057.1 phosphomannomutase [Collibacillus ludicampi]